MTDHVTLGSKSVIYCGLNCVGLAADAKVCELSLMSLNVMNTHTAKTTAKILFVKNSCLCNNKINTSAFRNSPAVISFLLYTPIQIKMEWINSTQSKLMAI